VTAVIAHSKLAFAPVTDIPYARVDLRGLSDPIPAILEAREFGGTTTFFAQSPSARRSLLSPLSQALLYTLIRNLHPSHVAEIGTYKGGTAEAMSRAVHANGCGTLHTVSPFDADLFGPTLARWPEQLRQRTRYHAVDSMMFFMQMDQEAIRLDLVLVDGHHDYEFARFDIEAAARRLTRGGFILIDNVAQAGPYRAAVEFLAAHPGWRDCGVRFAAADPTKAFDSTRTRIPDSDFYVLRAPFTYLVYRNPQTFGELKWNERPIRGLKLSLGEPRSAGVLHIQCILRAFSDTRIDEIAGDASCAIDASVDEIDVAFPAPIVAHGVFARHLVEPWLVWEGDNPLALSSPPTPY
jgi:predicted O-methyltransferase YrrM